MLKKFLKIGLFCFLVFICFLFLTLKNNDKNDKFIYFPKQNLFLKVELAKDPIKQQRGLMFRKFLNENEGMLFVYSKEQMLNFWMKNMEFPLDIIFISKEGIIIDIKSNLLPCKKDVCETFQSIKPAQYALEVNAGFVNKNNINLNDKIEFKI